MYHAPLEIYSFELTQYFLQWVVPGQKHSALFTRVAITAGDVQWASDAGEPPAPLLEGGTFRCMYKVRYSQSPLGMP